MLKNRDSKTKELKSKIRYRECADIFKSLESIEYAVIKGEPLSLAAYGEFGKRSSGDIDILISKKNIMNLEKILINNGFRMNTTISRKDRIFYLSQSHQLMPYVKLTPLLNIVIDINFDILWGGYQGTPIDMDLFLQNTIAIDIFGCSVKTLDPVKLFVQLCLHHYKELNSIFLLSVHNFYRKESFFDVYQLIKNNFTFKNILTIFDYCNQLQIVPYIYFIIYYTQLLFPCDIINAFSESFRTSTGVALLEHYGLTENRKKWYINFEKRMHTESLAPYLLKNLDKDELEKIELNKKYFM